MTFFPSNTITTDAALRDLTSERPGTRAAAASALAGCEPTRRGESAVALLHAIDDPDAEVRAAAALSLGELGADGDLPDLGDLGDDGPSPTEALILRLDDGAPAVRQCAAVALARMKATAALEPLRRALAAGPPDLRFQAATSLVEIDPASAAAPLTTALGDADGEVAGAAALGLGAIGDPAAAAAIAALLEHTRPRTRFDAAYALAELGDERAVPFLAQATAERDLAWDAIEALEAIGRPAAEALARLVTKERALDPEHRLRAATALLAIAPDHPEAPAAQRALLDPLRSWWRRRRGLAIDLLARVGGPWATGPLEQLRNTPSGRRLADEIGEALRRIGERAPRS
ncbi:MAG TPA: HEAT repeat domain-containing protein [Kofleriaceae bacterium]|nr:HEAT repeat domain-containing protein [Kofleriaceae bacterium]